MTNEQIQALVQLTELKKQGLLSQEEFDKKKADIINSTTEASLPLNQEPIKVTVPDTNESFVQVRGMGGLTLLLSIIVFILLFIAIVLVLANWESLVSFYDNYIV